VKLRVGVVADGFVVDWNVRSNAGKSSRQHPTAANADRLGELAGSLGSLLPAIGGTLVHEKCQLDDTVVHPARTLARRVAWGMARLADVGLFHLFWNWIGRSQEEIVQARRDWMEGARFGEVKGYDGAPLPAPELPPVPLKPRGRVR
jgi:HAMP domain-containing protein